MRNWVVCCWPGLPRIWYRAEVAGLSLALVFCILLNLAIATTFVWTELISSQARSVLWLTALAIWAGALVKNILRPPWDVESAQARDPQGLFSVANGEYLKGHFAAACTALERLLASYPRDVEARLLLATVLRHQEQYSAAEEHLIELQRLEAAEVWSWEINQEKRLIREAAGWDEKTSDS